MSRSDWLQYGAIAGLIVIVLSATAVITSWRYELKQIDQRQGLAPTKTYTANDQEDDACAGIIGLNEYRDCLTREAKADREEEREQYDLEAQQDMALWAFGVLWISGIGLLVTIAGVIYVALTLQANREAVRAARDQLELSRNAMIHTQRSFVFFKQFIFSARVSHETDDVHDWTVAAEWENSGETPTKRLLMHINMLYQPGPLPGDFDFPDYSSERVDNLIGPKATLLSGALILPMDLMRDLVARKTRLFVWGWAEYNDVFDRTRRHRTEFCSEVFAGGNPANREKLTFNWNTYAKHNGADEECIKPLQT